MSDTPRVYGTWAGDPKGVPEDATRCVKEVWREFTAIPGQCLKKRGHGLNGLYCKQHAKKHPATEQR